MKKIFENLYIFSKLTLSLTLLICILGILYVFYVNYQNENKLSQNQLSFEKELKNGIDSNNKLIATINNKIKQYERSLVEIKKSLDLLSKNEKINDITNVNESIELLNNNFKKLSEEITNFKNNNLNSFKDNGEKKIKIINDSKKDIIDLILIKYENNKKIDQELQYLRTIVSQNKLANFEKILILSNKSFSGFDYLQNQFSEEVNIYLKELTQIRSVSLFSKVISPYIKISPTSENQITNELIAKIKEIKIHIQNKNADNALTNLKSIKNYETIFKLSSQEINNYLNFKNELLGLI